MKQPTQVESDKIIPAGVLKKLSVKEIKPSQNNPRHLFDEEPLRDLKESIREHGVLVPITVFQIPAQEKYAILDGERRYRCCVELEEEGKEIDIPANIVFPPTKIAGLLYMFSIHNFREQWELMPTALSLQTVMDELNEEDNKKLSKLTGLSETQIERCKVLLSFEDEFKEMSLTSDPKKRIPSNFWIEAFPVIKLCENKLGMGRREAILLLIEKYQNKKIKSIIHFRRILEAEKKSAERNDSQVFEEKLENYIHNPNLETREAFDEFLPTRTIKTAITACDEFIVTMEKIESELIVEVDSDVVTKLKKIQSYLAILIEKIGKDFPDSND